MPYVTMIEKEKSAKKANMRILACALLFLAALFGVIWSSVRLHSLPEKQAKTRLPYIKFQMAEQIAFSQSVQAVSFVLLIITPLTLIMLIKLELHEDTILMLVEELEERDREKRVPQLPDTFEQEEE